jgi:hypothetical protein
MLAKNNRRFFQVANKRLLFIWIQKILGRPKVNQLANNALVIPRRSLKTGIDSAMMKAIIHSAVAMAAQIP